MVLGCTLPNSKEYLFSQVHTICALDSEWIVVGFGVDLAK